MMLKDILIILMTVAGKDDKFNGMVLLMNNPEKET
jgi:hypothetical protein